MSQCWESFRPFKTLWLWSVAGTAVLTMIVGFAAGGWTTGGNATKLAEDAGSSTRAELVANLCVERFVTGRKASQKLVELKDTSTYQRDTFITEGGWVKFAGMVRETPGATDRCADQLVAVEALPATGVTQSHRQPQ